MVTPRVGWRARLLMRSAYDPQDRVAGYASALRLDTATVDAARAEVLAQPTQAAAWRVAIGYGDLWDDLPRRDRAARGPRAGGSD